MHPGNRPARVLSAAALGAALVALTPLPALSSVPAPVSAPGSGPGEPAGPGKVEPGISWTNTLKLSDLGRRGAR
ncbi:hypothetical protein ACFQ08_39255 [Streptosporangium algeriense]|uniref:Uncharacterized protein n=1 Tax=Streptosporangium algeriense TaxID=1682748 RepID=A0ABW3E605_9ACTN